MGDERTALSCDIISETDIEHIGQVSGDKAVNTSIPYIDDEGNGAFTKPSPVVSATCSNTINVSQNFTLTLTQGA